MFIVITINLSSSTVLAARVAVRIRKSSVAHATRVPDLLRFDFHVKEVTIDYNTEWNSVLTLQFKEDEKLILLRSWQLL